MSEKKCYLKSFVYFCKISRHLAVKSFSLAITDPDTSLFISYQWAYIAPSIIDAEIEKPDLLTLNVEAEKLIPSLEKRVYSTQQCESLTQQKFLGRR